MWRFPSHPCKFPLERLLLARQQNITKILGAYRRFLSWVNFLDDAVYSMPWVYCLIKLIFNCLATSVTVEEALFGRPNHNVYAFTPLCLWTIVRWVLPLLQHQPELQDTAVRVLFVSRENVITMKIQWKSNFLQKQLELPSKNIVLQQHFQPGTVLPKFH